MKQVARSAGVKESTFLSYVDARERIPPADVAVRIANVLGVSVEYLVSGMDTPVSEADSFYQKYKKYEDILQSLDKIPTASNEQARQAIRMMLFGYLNSY